MTRDEFVDTDYDVLVPEHFPKHREKQIEYMSDLNSSYGYTASTIRQKEGRK